MTHKQHKKKHHKKKKSSAAAESSKTANWVERLDFVEVSPAPDTNTISSAPSPSTSSIPFRIVSWNILAQSYCNRRSHHHLPKLYMNVVFSENKRRDLLKGCLVRLCKLNLDVLCLQEVDMYDELCKVMEELGYAEVAGTPTSQDGGASGGRIDAVVVFARSDLWTIVNQQVIRLDDLATLGQQQQQHTSSSASLSGLQQSFLRRNMAILIRLQHIPTNQTLIICNAHLFWNPIYEYVKLCQAVYVCERIQEFSHYNEPIILCGDFNSTPSTSVHEYLTQKRWTNAKQTAPWYRGLDEQDDELLQEAFNDMSLQEESNNTRSSSPTTIRYMLDYTLNRLTRWLRILGIDAALETEQEEIERTKFNNHMVLFTKCKKERRTLITTSSKLTLRKDCPPGTYLVNARAPLESALVNVLLAHGVVLEPANFLSRCVVCNGSILDVVDEDHKRRVFAASNAPDLSNEVEMVYQCDGCSQGYWWSDNPTSSASRVKGQATRLFELCVRGGVPTCEDLGMFDYVNVEAEREKGLSEDGIELERLEVLKWLKDETLTNPLSLKSAFAIYDDESGEMIGEDLSFTNVTHDFVGLLDYVLFDSSITQTKRLFVPTSFNELNMHDLHDGHLLPSNIWPSDHLAIGAELQIPVAKEEATKEEDTTVMNGESMLCGTLVNGGLPPPPLPTAHAPRCTCGCVPQIRSLFEMAELRKRARAAKSTAN